MLVQGPPGTGKSFTGCLMIEILYRNLRNNKILLLTYTNHALDQMCEDLLGRELNSLVRLGTVKDKDSILND